MAKSGRRRDWAKATDDTDIFPAVDDDDPAEPSPTEEDDQPAESERFVDARLRLKRFGRAVVDRLPQLSVAIVAGLALCMSFPPFGGWYLAIAAFAMLAWLRTRESTTLAGGFGYGFLFGLAFYLPLLPWISGLVGAFPWIMLAAMEALFPALFGLGAVAVRRLSGWPFWFAAVWAAVAFAQEAYIGHKLVQQAADLRTQNVVLASQNRGYKKDVLAITSGSGDEEEARLNGYAKPQERLYLVTAVPSPSPATPASPAPSSSASPHAH